MDQRKAELVSLNPRLKPFEIALPVPVDDSSAPVAYRKAAMIQLQESGSRDPRIIEDGFKEIDGLGRCFYIRGEAVPPEPDWTPEAETGTYAQWWQEAKKYRT